MKIFTGTAIHELDKHTIATEPIASIDLMERASRALTEEIARRWDSSTKMVVLAGPGNNGGDALAVARMLKDRGYDVDTFLFSVGKDLSEDCATNRERLLNCGGKLHEIVSEFDPPALRNDMVVIDGIFGSGLNKPLGGGFAAVVRYVNASNAQVVSIDMPSGLMTEDNTYNIHQNILRADLTLTIGMKKLSMMLPDNQIFLGKVKVLDIGLSRFFIENTKTDYSILEFEDVKRMVKRRSDFAHKGIMGHALLMAGKFGMAGAAVLAAKACLRSGVGKVTVHTPRANNSIMQISVPEAIIHHDFDEERFTRSMDANNYSALGIGPGMGTDDQTAVTLLAQLRSTKVPTVVDADAINILATHRAWLQQLPEGFIFTPHPHELDRLFDSSPADDYDRLMRARDVAQRLHAYVLLKGHYSALCLPDGRTIFNNSGNSGMATAGSGDVLTGIITALLARGYTQMEAAMLGMYIHGLAGDLAAEEVGVESLIASDIIKYLPKAFNIIYE